MRSVALFTPAVLRIALAVTLFPHCAIPLPLLVVGLYGVVHFGALLQRFFPVDIPHFTPGINGMSVVKPLLVASGDLRKPSKGQRRASDTVRKASKALRRMSQGLRKV
jgi:hypothetical protein